MASGVGCSRSASQSTWTGRKGVAVRGCRAFGFLVILDSRMGRRRPLPVVVELKGRKGQKEKVGDAGVN